MNTTVDKIKEYLKNNYGLDFKYELYGTHRWLRLKKGKQEYTIHCDYAYHPDEELDCWSIYIDHMDYDTWYGNGRAIIDNGIETIDKIMEEWGFEKDNQLSLF